MESLRRPGRAIFIASHNLDELQRLADRVAIIDRGRLQRIVEPRGFAAAGTAPVSYVLTVAADDAENVLAIFPQARARGQGEFELPPLELAMLNAGLALLLQRGAMVSGLRPTHSMLEQHFREAIGQ